MGSVLYHSATYWARARMQGGGEFSGTAADVPGTGTWPRAFLVSSGQHLVEAFSETLRVPGPVRGTVPS